MNVPTQTTASPPSSAMRGSSLAAIGIFLSLGVIGGVISTIITMEQLQDVFTSWLLPRLWH